MGKMKPELKDVELVPDAWPRFEQFIKRWRKQSRTIARERSRNASRGNELRTTRQSLSRKRFHRRCERGLTITFSLNSIVQNMAERIVIIEKGFLAEVLLCRAHRGSEDCSDYLVSVIHGRASWFFWSLAYHVKMRW